MIITEWSTYTFFRSNISQIRDHLNKSSIQTLIRVFQKLYGIIALDNFNAILL